MDGHNAHATDCDQLHHTGMNTEKNALRKYIREMKRQFTKEDLEELSLPIISRLLANPHVASARIILMYYSLADEVCTHEAISTLLNSGKTVLLPRVIDGENMEIRIYSKPEDLALGHYGIMEPTGTLFTDYAKIDVAVIPGMAFDTEGHRLGRGKGYYDRFLPKATKAYKIGVCFDFQKQDAIPTGPYDMAMDCVL